MSCLRGENKTLFKEPRKYFHTCRKCGGRGPPYAAVAGCAIRTNRGAWERPDGRAGLKPAAAFRLLRLTGTGENLGREFLSDAVGRDAFPAS